MALSFIIQEKLMEVNFFPTTSVGLRALGLLNTRTSGFSYY